MIQSLLGDKYTSKSVKAKVELYDGDTLVETCTCSKAEGIGNGAGALANFSISRAGELGKYFGFGVSHKLEMTLVDLEKVLRIYEGYTAKVCLGNGTIFDCPYPTLEITNVKVDKKTGDITVSASDLLYKASNHTFSELNIEAPYTIKQLLDACSDLLGLPIKRRDNTLAFLTLYNEGANYQGDETIRELFNHIAEVTQTIYYINNANEIVFVSLSDNSVAEYHRQDYYNFEVGTAKALKGICSATELGDNILEENEGEGVIQYVRDNPLWELRPDIVNLLKESLNRMNGLTLQQFELDWSGDYRLEVGDCITIYFDDEPTNVHILNDTIAYAGTMDEETEWEYIVPVTETATNPTTIGDKINQTFARVDKVNREIELVASKADENATNIASLKLTTDEVVIKVEETSKKIEAFEESGLSDLTEKVEEHEQKLSILQVSVDDITAEVSKVTEIESTVNTHTTQLGSLQIRSDEIVNKVSVVEQTIEQNSDDIVSISNEVGMKLDKEGVEITVEEILAEGVEKVVTASKKYTFDDTGLNVVSSSNNISTIITEDGMRISRSGEEVLVANNEGVRAEDLHATTYLIIGNTSRLEDRGNRTACYWIGGTDA